MHYSIDVSPSLVRKAGANAAIQVRSTEGMVAKGRHISLIKMHSTGSMVKPESDKKQIDRLIRVAVTGRYAFKSKCILDLKIYLSAFVLDPLKVQIALILK